MSEQGGMQSSTDSTDAAPDDPIVPAPDDPPSEPEPEPVPPAPTPETIVWEPYTWYSITYACTTTGCPNQNVVGSASMFYSNNGDPRYIRVIDSTCGKDSQILTATKLDPQPPEE